MIARRARILQLAVTHDADGAVVVESGVYAYLGEMEAEKG
jgi:hypothetical protein